MKRKAFFVVFVVLLTMLMDQLLLVIMYFLFGNVENYVYCVIDSVTMSFSCACAAPPLPPQGWETALYQRFQRKG